MRATEFVAKLVEAIAEVGDNDLVIQNKDDGAELPFVEIDTTTGDVFVIVKDLGSD